MRIEKVMLGDDEMLSCKIVLPGDGYDTDDDEDGKASFIHIVVRRHANSDVGHISFLGEPIAAIQSETVQLALNASSKFIDKILNGEETSKTVQIKIEKTLGKQPNNKTERLRQGCTAAFKDAHQNRRM